jgi:hypothetical protein
VYDEDELQDESFRYQRKIKPAPICDCSYHDIQLPKLTFHQLGRYSIGNELPLRRLRLPKNPRDDDGDDDLPALDPRLRSKYSRNGDEGEGDKNPTDDDGDDDLPALDPRLRSKYNRGEDDSDSLPLVRRPRPPNRRRHNESSQIEKPLEPSEIPQQLLTTEQWKVWIDALRNLLSSISAPPTNTGPNTPPPTNKNYFEDSTSTGSGPTDTEPNTPPTDTGPNTPPTDSGPNTPPPTNKNYFEDSTS